MPVREEGGVSGGPEMYRMVAIYSDLSCSEDRLGITRADYRLNLSMYDELLRASGDRGQELRECTFRIISAHGDMIPGKLAALAVCGTAGLGGDGTLRLQGPPRAAQAPMSWVFTDSEPTPVGDMVVEQDPSEEWLGTLVPAKRRGNIFSMGTQGSPVVALPNPEAGKPPFDNVEALITAGGLWVALHRGSSEPGQFFETVVGR